MDRSIEIRPYRKEDLSQIDALEARVQPYRPEDQAEVAAIYSRALHAQQSNDPRWTAFPAFQKRAMEDEWDAFWVAERQDQNRPSLVGMVGVQAFRAGEVISARHHLVEAWQERGGIAELRRLRVAPEVRGQSLGTRLCQTVIEWSRQRYGTLVVNTTTPQKPALQLYRKLGFEEVGLSFINRYELIWLELRL